MNMRDRLGIGLVGNCQPAEGYNKSVFKAVTGFFTGGEEAKYAKEAQRLAAEQERARQRMQEVEAERERKKALRESIIRRGEVTASAAGAGVGMAGTSPIAGGLSSITSQTASNIANITRGEEGSKVLGNLGTQIASAQNKMQQAARKSAAVGSIFSLALQGYTGFKSV